MKSKILPACGVDKPYIFISYSHKDEEKVRIIIARLQEMGVRVWYDEGIGYSENFDEILEERIANCSVLVGFLSNAFVASKWCRKEINYADNSENSISILPAYLEKTELRNGLGLRYSDSQSVYLDKHDSLDEFAEAIAKWLKGRFPEVFAPEVEPQVDKEKSPLMVPEFLSSKEVGVQATTVETKEVTDEIEEEPEVASEKGNWARSFLTSVFGEIYEEDYVHVPEVKKGPLFRTGNTYRDKTKEILPLRWYRNMFLLSIVLIATIGTFCLYSISHEYAAEKCGNPFYYTSRQILYFLIGFICLFIISKIPYQKIMTFSVFFYVITLALLVLMNLGFGVRSYGTVRWIRIGSLYIKPGAYFLLGYLLLVAYIVKSSYRKKEDSSLYFTIWVVGVISAVMGVGLGHETGLGLSILFMTYWIAAISTGKVKIHAIIMAVFTIALYGVFYMLHMRGSIDIPGFYVTHRLEGFLFPDAYPYDFGFIYILLRDTVQKGGLWGKGIGSAGAQMNLVPEGESSNILALIHYEWGFLAVLVLFALFFVMFRNLLKLYLFNKSVFGSTYLVGLFVQLLIYVVSNVLITYGALPYADSYLPFVSYTGTNNMLLLIEVGIAISISKAKKGSVKRK